MKRSIFAPLMWLSLSIILVCAFVMGIVHTVLLDRYIISTKTNALLQSARRISELTLMLSRNYGPQLENFYVFNLDLIAQSSQSFIIITDKNGKIINYSTHTRKYITTDSLSLKGFESVMEGDETAKIGPYNSIFGEKTFTVAVPVQTGGKVYGAVFLNSPVPDVYKDRHTLFTMLAVSILISSLLAFILSFFMSKGITKPIRALGRAAHDIARGNYKRRVEISNIAELAELGAAFNTMAESVENHEKVRTAFIGNVSHDLRTPMTTISGFIEGILDGTVPKERQDEYLTIVLNETKRLSRLVSTFLDISKYEENKVELKKTSFDIIEMIRVVILSFQSRTEAKKVGVNFEFEGESAFVHADENEIYRVIMNLMDNAVKFVEPEGKIDISVVTDGAKTRISVGNTGEGIAESDSPYVWDRFYKADKSRTEAGNGTGLGLFIVKSIINQHGEEIILDNKPNYTKFTFTLPTVK
ncbi:MAG: Alkaline phosphatase synthesis sensor protein PhoR [Firmicutes bacterium ADurb.Bin193]|nr:MAG: Alkaline phosphatase synthesis sensor protein PhoR [Firmicutes bacterium ADurb.Bin193]